jgi:hypothetical protein
MAHQGSLNTARPIDLVIEAMTLQVRLFGLEQQRFCRQ